MQNTKQITLQLLMTTMCFSLLVSCKKDNPKENSSSQQSTTTTVSADIPVGVVDNKINRKKILDLVNELRKTGCKCENNGIVTDMKPVPPLSWSTDLEKIAYGHSLDMDLNNYFSHESLDGKSFEERYKAIGYILIPDGTPNHGENIAAGQTTEEQVISSWRNSKTGHCNTMLSPYFNEMGVGFSNRKQIRWTQNFGRR